MQVMQSLHNDGKQGQVELSNMSSDLRISVARVCIMTAHQGVNCTDGLFMEEEDPVGKTKAKTLGVCCTAHMSMHLLL